MTDSRPFRAAMRNISIIVAGGLTISGEPGAALIILLTGLALAGFVHR